MTLNLLNKLSNFESLDDRESDVAFFKTRVPWVGSEAYLHIIFKPADEEVLSKANRALRIPQELRQFLQVQNGAHLFSGAINIYGVVRAATLLNRDDSFSLPPFNIEWENSAVKPWERDKFLAVGSYSFDGSSVCIDRETHRISIFSRAGERSAASWPNFDQWIGAELSRLSKLYTCQGKSSSGASATVPLHGTTIQSERD